MDDVRKKSPVAAAADRVSLHLAPSARLAAETDRSDTTSAHFWHNWTLPRFGERMHP
jgi:hypothetical protein